jgi:predicted DNA-binding protein
VYFVVGDADALYEFHRDNGVEIAEPIDDRAYGIRDYSIRDSNGYYLTFGHPIYTVGPKVEIERVDVPLRLEKRLAARLDDLAKHKRMSLSSCVEEILLHTNDGVEPHTNAVAHIRELKKKHGIDYDSHASYRWVWIGRIRRIGRIGSSVSTYSSYSSHSSIRLSVLSREDLFDEIQRARIARLREPEHRLLADFPVLVSSPG